jgi:hypothetical protein
MFESNTRSDQVDFFQRWDHLWSKKNVQAWASRFAIGAILTYAVCGGLSMNEHPIWYRVLTSLIMLNLALLVSALLCLRNGLSRRMPSGRNVWTLLGCALLSFLGGNIFFSAWEFIWGLNPAGSLGDPFFLMFYIFLPLAMSLAILRKKVRLQGFQWFFLVATGAFASLIVVVITLIMPTSTATATTDPAPVVQAEITQSNNTQSPVSSAPAIQAPASTSTSVPVWVSAIDSALKPHATNLNYFYVWSDVALFCLATAIVMGFWGSKLNRAWIVCALAVACFYVSDMWFAYAALHIENYQSGFCLEIFWTFGAILFGIAAATEFDLMLVRRANQHLDSDLNTPSEIFYR